MKTLTLYNLKGGVGKTAAAVNLAYLAAESGYRTLLCDFDPQGSTTYYLRVRPPKGLKSKTIIQGGKALRETIRESDYPNLDLLPAALSFRNLERDLSEAKHGKTKTRVGTTLNMFRRRYDLIVLDAPPSIGLDAENLIRAADLTLVPLVPTVLSLNAFEKILGFAEKRKLTPETLCPFVSMADTRKKLHRELTEQVITLGRGRFKAVIPYASDVERMGVVREPVVVSTPRGKASLAFRELWKETESFLFPVDAEEFRP
jgi:chromosome partitioning protein